MLNVLTPLKITQSAQALKNTGWRQVLTCYGIYAAAMTIAFFTLPRLLNSGEITNTLGGYALACAACLAYILTLGKRTRASLGMESGGFRRQYGLGWLFAAGFLFLVWAVNFRYGAISTHFNSAYRPGALGLLLIGFILQGFMEEFLMRGLIMTQVATRFGVIIGIFANSLLFALAHLGNSNANYLSALNTFLIGVLFSVQFYYHDNIWLVSGFHSGWNFILGPVLGIPVSGFVFPTSLFISETEPAMKALNGGSYGFESGLPVTIISIAAVVVYAALMYKQRDKYLTKSA